MCIYIYIDIHVCFIVNCIYPWIRFIPFCCNIHPLNFSYHLKNRPLSKSHCKRKSSIIVQYLFEVIIPSAHHLISRRGELAAVDSESRFIQVWNIGKLMGIHVELMYPLVMTNTAMEAMALIEIDGLPIKNAWWIFPWQTVSHNQSK